MWETRMWMKCGTNCHNGFLTHSVSISVNTSPISSITISTNNGRSTLASLHERLQRKEVAAKTVQHYLFWNYWCWMHVEAIITTFYILSTGCAYRYDSLFSLTIVMHYQLHFIPGYWYPIYDTQYLTHMLVLDQYDNIVLSISSGSVWPSTVLSYLPVILLLRT